MRITIGWGAVRIEYRERSGGENFYGQMEFIEQGGYGATPTGISYVWTFDPAHVDHMIGELRRVKAEHEAWVAKVIAEEGHPP